MSRTTLPERSTSLVSPPQQARVQGDEVSRGARAQLLTEQPADLVVCLERFRDVPTRGQRLHPQPVTTLAERSPLDKRRGCPLGGRQLGSPEAETGLRHQLERLELELLELATLLFDPWRLESRQKAALRDREGSVRGAPSRLPILIRGGRSRPREGIDGELDVDLGSDSSAFPLITPGPSACRRREMRELREAAGSAGGRSGQMQSTSSSRRTALSPARAR